MHRFKYILLWLLLLQSVHTDQLAPCFPAAHVDVPRNNISVPANIRFRIGFFPVSCRLNGPEFQFKFVNAQGREAAFAKVPWQHYIELKAIAPLDPGGWTLKVRQPVSANKLGSWQNIAVVNVISATDISTPGFAGISSAYAQAVRGLVPLSPCELREAWVIKTKITFTAAVDSQCPHDQLLYLLERRRPDSAKWRDSRVFRPAEQDGDMIFEVETSGNEWEQRWVYRLRVRDWAGNETIGRGIAAVQNPQKPVE
jgi:hypothetical protein